jgi:hypothetical protein
MASEFVAAPDRAAVPDSADHRVIDGALATRFNVFIAATPRRHASGAGLIKMVNLF